MDSFEDVEGENTETDFAPESTIQDLESEDGGNIGPDVPEHHFSLIDSDITAGKFDLKEVVASRVRVENDLSAEDALHLLTSVQAFSESWRALSREDLDILVGAMNFFHMDDSEPVTVVGEAATFFGVVLSGQIIITQEYLGDVPEVSSKNQKKHQIYMDGKKQMICSKFIGSLTVGSMIGGLSMFFSSATRTQTMKADGDDCIMAVFPLDTFHQLNREQPLLGYKLLKICMAEAERKLATERTLMLPEETFKDFPAQYTSDGFYRKLRKAHSINHGLGPGFNTPEDLKDLCRHMSMHRAAQDDQVLTEGQLTSSMVFLLEGEIQLKFTSNLKRATELDTVIRQQGMWVGDDAFFTALYKGKAARVCTGVVASQDATFAVLTSNDMKAMYLSKPRLALQLLQTISAQRLNALLHEIGMVLAPSCAPARASSRPPAVVRRNRSCAGLMSCLGSQAVVNTVGAGFLDQDMAVCAGLLSEHMSIFAEPGTARSTWRSQLSCPRRSSWDEVKAKLGTAELSDVASMMNAKIREHMKKKVPEQDEEFGSHGSKLQETLYESRMKEAEMMSHQSDLDLVNQLRSLNMVRKRQDLERTREAKKTALALRFMMHVGHNDYERTKYNAEIIRLRDIIREMHNERMEILDPESRDEAPTYEEIVGDGIVEVAAWSDQLDGIPQNESDMEEMVAGGGMGTVIKEEERNTKLQKRIRGKSRIIPGSTPVKETQKWAGQGPKKAFRRLQKESSSDSQTQAQLETVVKQQEEMRVFMEKEQIGMREEMDRTLHRLSRVEMEKQELKEMLRSTEDELLDMKRLVAASGLRLYEFEQQYGTMWLDPDDPSVEAAREVIHHCKELIAAVVPPVTVGSKKYTVRSKFSPLYGHLDKLRIKHNHPVVDEVQKEIHRPRVPRRLREQNMEAAERYVSYHDAPLASSRISSMVPSEPPSTAESRPSLSALSKRTIDGQDMESSRSSHRKLRTAESSLPLSALPPSAVSASAVSFSTDPPIGPAGPITPWDGGDATEAPGPTKVTDLIAAAKDPATVGVSITVPTTPLETAKVGSQQSSVFARRRTARRRPAIKEKADSAPQPAPRQIDPHTSPTSWGNSADSERKAGTAPHPELRMSADSERRKTTKSEIPKASLSPSLLPAMLAKRAFDESYMGANEAFIEYLRAQDRKSTKPRASKKKELIIEDRKKPAMPASKIPARNVVSTPPQQHQPSAKAPDPVLAKALENPERKNAFYTNAIAVRGFQGKSNGLMSYIPRARHIPPDNSMGMFYNRIPHIPVRSSNNTQSFNDALDEPTME
ncbi:hypothetical protein CYMTET_47534 [Cymbomonas tetramitiformis]|uniref:Cyclic nucleotide-binding domain-containing protein n=1 Tax=Cymbomonas tetramitiformis TaxID=36881 RepID=A0AAE0BVE5_9CHLO|nr:hypothetical protein CYMTET_47534 [Cymbomonas tetramitiformis]